MSSETLLGITTPNFRAYAPEKVFEMNPLEWYQRKFCSKCKEHTCETKGGIYTVNWNAKLACIQSAKLFLELDRPLFRKITEKRE